MRDSTALSKHFLISIYRHGGLEDKKKLEKAENKNEDQSPEWNIRIQV